MRTVLRLCGGLAAAALVVSACGSSGGNTQINGKTPADIVQLAAAHLGDTSFRMDLDAVIKSDSSGLHGISAQDLQAFGPLAKGVTVNGTADVESSKRVQIVLQIPGVSQSLVVVLYDGIAYAATDGTHFAVADSVSSITGGISVDPADLKTDFSNLGSSLRDMGQSQQDGQTTEHYHATLGKDFILKALSQPGTQNAQLASVLAQFISFNDGTADVYVLPGSGRLDRGSFSFSLSLDIGKLAAAFGGSSGTPGAGQQQPTGSLVLNGTIDIHARDYGASIHVTRPTVDPSATPFSGSGLFAGSGGAASGSTSSSSSAEATPSP